ncbi:PEP-CTERM sorting domain-containing protein [Nostoc sp. TCL26-01]|uniref:PEP-CTERM sorting domain-containing protein n=1 Tax=Nostoc sp. TCL26-01 TaxID=2576904 RepID=UPI0015BED102|nr:PEP-CTERM sorting domain-containing protein [Nostoc sp. TCL26-01]QLE55685.1 PEP-CTERM sorting domain-containing protein [Nostoc sp. TCL26-01]
MKSTNKNLKHFLLTISSAVVSTSVGIGGYVSQAQAAQFVNIVQNGDFTADSLLNPNDPTRANPFITGWYNSTQNETFYTTYLENYTVDREADLSRSVRMAAFPDFTYISQNLNTKKNQKYQLTYYLANSDEEDLSVFRTYIGGNLVDEKPHVPFQDFTKYTLNFTATSAITELKFAAHQRKAWYNLDNVSVVRIDDGDEQSTSVPEPSIMAGLAVLGMMGIGTRKNRLASNYKSQS